MARPKNVGANGEIADARDKRVSLFLTSEDDLALREYAELCGFRSPGELLTAIVERLLIGGFAPIVWIKVALQLVRRAESRGFAPKSFYFGVRPLPPLPDEDLPAKEIKSVLKEVERELVKQA